MSIIRTPPLRLKQHGSNYAIKETTDMNSISFFSGILGLDKGLEEAGFSTVYALDHDKDCAKVVKENYPNLIFENKDIKDISANEILSTIGKRRDEITLLAGGPPCQPFSKSGLRKGLKDQRGNLFAHYIRILTDIKPKAFIIENVRGILSSNQGKDFQDIIQGFDDTGYHIYWKVLDAANYGVPQFRQRLFLVGFRDRISFEFPKETHKECEFVTLREAFKGLSTIGKYPKYAGKYSDLLSGIPPGLNYSYYCAERGHPNPKFAWRSKFWYFLLKADPDKPSLTIQAQPGNNTGPFHWENRRFGINELKRIQTLPDTMDFDNLSYLTIHRLIGNAVPTKLAYNVGIKIKEALEKNMIISKEEYLKKRNMLNGHKLKSGNGSGKGRLSNDKSEKQILLNALL